MDPRAFLSDATLARKLSLMLVALLIPMIVVGVIISRGLSSNAQDLLAARRVKELATRSLVLMLTQDDVTTEIEALILSVQGEVENAIEAMAAGTARVESTVSRSAAAGAAIEELTRSSRESGDQIGEIAEAIQEQAAAARNIVGFMRQTQEAVGVIRGSVVEQGDSNATVRQSVDVVRETASQIADATALQAESAERMSANVEGVRAAAAAVEEALQEQTRATQRLSEFLERVGHRCQENTRSATITSETTEELRALAQVLHEHVSRFSLQAWARPAGMNPEPARSPSAPGSGSFPRRKPVGWSA